jgi:predicted porin
MKKQQALALAAFVSTAAGGVSAQPAGALQIYGFAAPMIDFLSVRDAAASASAVRPSMLRAAAYNGAGNGRLLRMQSSVTHLGFRGTEELGGGLAAIFQLEHGFQVDSGAATGAANAPFFNRNTAVGLQGGFGRVLLGSWDTPIAWSHLGYTNGVRNPYAGDSSVIFLTPGFHVPNSAMAENRSNNPTDATFNRRQGNSVQYWTPKWGGFSGRVFYSLPEGDKTAANGVKYQPSVTGLGIEYAQGPVVLRYVHQRHTDYFGLAWLGPNQAANPDAPGSTASGSRDTAHRIIARYTISPHWVVQGALDRQSFGASGVAAGSVDHYRRTAWSAQLLHRQGAHTGWINYGRAGDGSCTLAGGGACNTDDLGADTWSVGWRYDFSRRTDLFVAAYAVRNRANGQYGAFPRPVAGIAPGSHTRGVTVGVEHSF